MPDPLPFALHWDEPDPRFTPLPALPGSRCLVIWPSRVNADSCFASAGFQEFTDTDARWDEAFELLGRLLVHCVSDRAGEPHRMPVRRSSFFERLTRKPAPALTPVSALLDAAYEDGLGLVTVQFGAPPVAALSTADGHPLWWLHSTPSPGDLGERILSACGGAFALSRRELDWTRLSPFAREVPAHDSGRARE